MKAKLVAAFKAAVAKVKAGVAAVFAKVKAFVVSKTVG